MYVDYLASFSMLLLLEVILESTTLSHLNLGREVTLREAKKPYSYLGIGLAVVTRIDWCSQGLVDALTELLC